MSSRLRHFPGTRSSAFMPSPPSAPTTRERSEPQSTTARPAVLRDAWPWARPFHLDGWLDRRSFSPLVSAALVFVVAWVLFQLIAALVVGFGIGLDLAISEEAASALGDSAEWMRRYPGLMLIGNTAGQVIGLGLMAWGAAHLSTRSGKASFLRLRRPELKGLGLAVLGWGVSLPLLLWLGDLNASLPLPEWLEDLERLQTDLLDGLLLEGRVGTGGLLLALAVTPALFEEFLFRGYFQRQVERRWGATASIVLVGLLFGMYHVRFSQLLPLAMLGIYIGFAVWATGSLWTGSLVHVLHNGAAILVTGALRRSPNFGEAKLAALAVPWWLVLASAALTVALVGLLRRRRRAVVGERPDADEVSFSDLQAEPPPSY